MIVSFCINNFLLNLILKYNQIYNIIKKEKYMRKVYLYLVIIVLYYRVFVFKLIG